MHTIGIDNLSFYIPENRIAVDTILAEREKEGKSIHDSLISGKNTTKQNFLRITQPWQDSTCLAAQSVFTLYKDSIPKETRYLISATETPVDSAKPIAAYTLGLLHKKYQQVPSHVLTYQTLHACAGGIISLLHLSTMIQQSSLKKSQGIITTSDIAHYKTSTNAEITQGAGAVALSVSENPRLLDVNTQQIGTYSSDVDDFFRPLDSHVAMVKGRYSMMCYIQAIKAALQDLAQQKNCTLLEIIKEHDYIVAHAPFSSMPKIALSHILKRNLNVSSEETAKIIAQKKVLSSSSIIRELGNTYTSSIFFTLGNLLEIQYHVEGDDIIGKKILLISYGAGNNATILQTTIQKHAPHVISQWNLSEQIKSYRDIDFEQYQVWCNTKETIPARYPSSIRKNFPLVFLQELRDDKYRVYGIS